MEHHHSHHLETATDDAYVVGIADAGAGAGAVGGEDGVASVVPVVGVDDDLKDTVGYQYEGVLVVAPRLW